MFRIFARVPAASIGFALRAGARTVDLFRSEIQLPAILMALVRADTDRQAELLFKRAFFDVPGIMILTSSPIMRDQLASVDLVYFDMAEKTGIASVLYTEGAFD